MNKIDQICFLDDGRRLGFAEYGSADGIPVLFFHGSGSSRLDRPASEGILTRLGIRFVSVDRPGHGLSDPQPGRRLLDWPNDIAQLADQLGISRFYVIGHSAGGPHALACAYSLPVRVLAAAAVSSVAPMGRPGAYQGMPPLNQLLARSARQFPWLTRTIRWLTRSMVMGDPEKATRQLMASIPDADKAVLYRPENMERMVHSLREGFCQGSEAVALDDILVNREWGLKLEDVKPRVDIWHGEEDVNVPVHAGRYLADMIPNNRVYFLAGEGHFMILTRWEEILANLVAPWS